VSVEATNRIAAMEVKIDRVVTRLDFTDHEQCYRERDFFHFNGGSSEFAACFRYALAYSVALSLPCLIPSTGSEGAIQLFVFTLCTAACRSARPSAESQNGCAEIKSYASSLGMR
jgi:hypothetical protein